MELFDSFCDDYNDDYNKETISARSHLVYHLYKSINYFGETDKIRGAQFFQCRMHHLFCILEILAKRATKKPCSSSN